MSDQTFLSPTYDIIRELAVALAKQMNSLERYKPIMTEPKELFDATQERLQCYKAAIQDDIIAVGGVVHKRFPEFNMNLWYQWCGYQGTFPVH